MTSRNIFGLLLFLCSSSFFGATAAADPLLAEENLLDLNEEIPEENPTNNDDPDVANCIADPSTNELLDLLLFIDRRDQEAGTWFIPTDVLEFEPRSNNGPILLLGKESFEWFSNVIPDTYDKDNIRNFRGLPPPPISLFPFQTQLFPFLNYQWDAASWGHKKFAAFPRWIVAVLGNDPSTYRSEILRNSIFAKNLEDRGPDNLLKKQYMSALTCDKMPLYLPKMEAAVDKLVQDIAVNGKPIMSSFFRRNLELFFDLHLEGATGHPEYILEYAELFTELLAPGDDEYALVTKRAEALRATCLYPKVEAYFEERRQFVIDNGIQSTFVYWWDKAGIPLESVVFEAAHNLLAWGQLGMTLFNILRAKVKGYVALENLLEDPVLDRPLDFFAKMKAVQTDNERLDVAREVFRLLVPTQFIASQTETKGPNYNRGKALGDDNFERTFDIILPLFVQIINDGFDPAKLTSEFANYDTGRYEDFQPPPASSGGCPFASGEFLDFNNLDTAFGVSDVDGETVVPVSHADYFPVFESGERRETVEYLVEAAEDGSGGEDGKIHGAKYCPFGLGYRRCPAELFNILYVQIFLDKLGDLDFRVEGGEDLYDEPEPGAADFDESVPFGLNRVRDNLFVA